MSVRSDLMVQQYYVAKKSLEVATDPDNNSSHDVSSHALAHALYKIDKNRTEDITTLDRCVVYGYILRRIEQGHIAGTEEPEEMIAEVTRLFNEFVDDFEADTEATGDYGKPFGGIALALVELFDLTQEVAGLTKDVIQTDTEQLAIEVVADFIDLTRQDEELYQIKEQIEGTF